MVVGVKAIGKVVIKNNTENDITIKYIRVKPDEMTVNVKRDDVIKAKGNLTIEATVMPKVPGRFNGSILIKTDHPDQAKINISAYGQVIEKSGAEDTKK